MYRDRRARWGGCALPPEAPAASGCGRDRRARCGGCALPPDGPAASGCRPRTAIELRHPCPLRWRRSVATTIHRCQRGGHALVCRRRRPWRRYGGVCPRIGRRLRRRSGSVERSRRSLGAHRGAAAAGLAPRRPRGQRCPAEVPAPPIPRAGSSADRAAGASPQPPSSVSLPKDRAGCSADRAAGAGVQPPALVPCHRRQRHSGLLLRAPLRWRSRPACRPCRRIRFRRQRFRRLRCMRLWRLARACLPAPTSAPAPRSPRVVALQAVLHQPLHELPQRQVRVHVRQQCA